MATQFFSPEVRHPTSIINDLNWALTGSGATIETTNPATGAAAVSLNFASITYINTSIRMRPLVPIRFGFSFRYAVDALATTNIFELYTTAVQREISINSTGEILYANGGETQLGGTLLNTNVNTTYWVIGELFPWGKRPWERIWLFDGTTWTLGIDLIYAPVNGGTSPTRQLDVDAWGVSGSTVTVIFGNFSKSFTTFTCIYDDVWAGVPPSDSDTLEYVENNRRGRLRIDKMMPDGDTTTQWDKDTAGGTHASRVDEVPAVAVVAVATDPRDQVDTAGASKVDQFTLGAMPAGKRPIAVKIPAHGTVDVSDPTHLQVGIISGADERLKTIDASGSWARTVGVGAAASIAPEVFEHPPNATSGAWTEALVNAAEAKMTTLAGNTTSYRCANIGAEVLYEDGAARDLRCEPLVSAW